MGRQLAMGGAALGAVTVLGVPLGLLWWMIAPRAEVTATGSGTTLPYPVSETLFAAEGYFAIMTLVAGLVCGYVGYVVQYRFAAWLRADLRLATLLGLAVGAVAASLIAWGIGVALDAGDYERALAAAERGDVISSGLQLRSHSALLLWPFVAVLQFGLFDAVSIWRHDLPHLRTDASEHGSAPAEWPR
ncbi:hypothetical protein HDA32_003689 [Spinactinospora alkalitolerans]|uniref:DUF2567 domain-containing protein n=1 Tax=Spinactinospora alkalitolerans TaxID=687207 RepID=A0A852TX28_9ACTN|nr:hypothetical protein [Spinactinospora alkalitolerans]NYE48569.1 hypothetical protein [Spinactinospora alkalitolerans]